MCLKIDKYNTFKCFQLIPFTLMWSKKDGLELTKLRTFSELIACLLVLAARKLHPNT